MIAQRRENAEIMLHQVQSSTAAGAGGGTLWRGLIGLIFLAPLLGMAVCAAAGPCAVGLWLIISGLIGGIIALIRSEDRGARLLVALVDIVLGGLLLALPELSLGTVAVLCGLAFLVRGAFAVYTGLKLRKAVR